MFPIWLVSGALTAAPRGRLLAASGSWFAAPGELRLVDTGGAIDSAEHPATASIGNSKKGRIRMIELQM